MKKIGILVINNHSRSGGISQYTESLIDALSEDKSNHYVIFCNDNRFVSSKFEIRKIKKFNENILSPLRKIQYIFGIQQPFTIPKKEQKLYADIDLFISPVPNLYPHYFLKKSFIFTLHDMQEMYYPEFFNIRERIIRRLKNKLLVRHAEKILCESNYVKGDIQRFLNTDESKISVIASPPPKCFLNFVFNEENFEKVKKKYNLPEFFIFYPANYWRHKNHNLLIDAFSNVIKKYPNIHLVLSGSLNNNLKEYERKINSHNLENKVHHIGFIDYIDLPYLYKLSQFLVMPSLFESISIPIFEAFSLKVAVCSSNVFGVKDQVGKAGLTFDPLNIDDIDNKISLYLEDKKLINKMGISGFKKFMGLSHEKYKRELLKIINS